MTPYATGSKAAAVGKLNGPGAKVVTPEEMEFSRLRAENIRLQRENEILKKAPVLLTISLQFRFAKALRGPLPFQRMPPTNSTPSLPLSATRAR
jgi:hypothetical protein